MICSNITPWLKTFSLLVLSVGLFGCSSMSAPTTSSSNYEPPVYVRDRLGFTHYRIQDGNVFKPNGERVARIDSSGTVWSPTGSRLAKITKK